MPTNPHYRSVETITYQYTDKGQLGSKKSVLEEFDLSDEDTSHLSRDFFRDAKIETPQPGVEVYDISIARDIKNRGLFHDEYPE